MTDEISVHVAVGEENILAGRMYSHRRRGIESASFAYETGYLARPDAYALDPALPLVSGTQQTPVGRALFGAFADSLPDRWGRNLIHRKTSAPPSISATRAPACRPSWASPTTSAWTPARRSMCSPKSCRRPRTGATSPSRTD